MSEKLFEKLLFAITIIGSVATIALTVITVIKFKNCSIIEYIAREWWW